MPKESPKTNRRRWFGRIDVLNAFRIVSREIRIRCRQYAHSGLTQREASDLAKRIKDQRKLIQQLADRPQHARRLMRLNTRLRERLIGIVERAGLDKDILVFK
jgi:uncharacterized membrane protein YccC